MLTLGDSQVVTGISILVSGYIQLACGLQYYHWLIVVDLAFFSSVTHLTTLTCLRSYFQKRPAVRAWRLVSMGVTSVLLAVALQSTGYDDPGHDWPAQCFLTHKLGHFEGTADSGTYRYDSLYVAIVLCFLSLSYVSRVVQLFPSTQVIMRNHFRSRPSNLFRAWLVRVGDCATLSSRKSTRDSSHLVHMLLLSIYCLLKAVLDLYGSLLWEVCL